MKPRSHNKSFDEMVEEATVDSYGPDEQAWGWQCMLEENISFPFGATFLGEPITVEGVDVDDDIVVAVCQRNSHRGKVGITELRFDSKKYPVQNG